MTAEGWVTSGVALLGILNLFVALQIKASILQESKDQREWVRLNFVSKQECMDHRMIQARGYGAGQL